MTTNQSSLDKVCEEGAGLMVNVLDCITSGLEFNHCPWFIVLVFLFKTLNSLNSWPLST